MSNRHGNQSGGGGGTFVSINGLRNPLIVAGGGGGTRGQSGDADGTDASLTEDGEDARGSNRASGGTGGNGGESASGSYGNGGGGFFSGGGTENSHSAGPGNAFVDGGECTYEDSGFGGGGGYGSDGGGGGGGYSGGGGGQGGGGGGSFTRSDASQISKEVGHDGHGELTIEMLSTPLMPGYTPGQYVPSDGVLPDGRSLALNLTQFSIDEAGNVSGCLKWSRPKSAASPKSEVAAETIDEKKRLLLAVENEIAVEKLSGSIKDGVIQVKGIEVVEANDMDGHGTVGSTSETEPEPESEQRKFDWCPLGEYSIKSETAEDSSCTLNFTIQSVQSPSTAVTTVVLNRQTILSWEQHIQSMYGSGVSKLQCEAETVCPCGFKRINDGTCSGHEWNNADDVQLVAFMDSIDGKFEGEHVTSTALSKYPRLHHRKPSHILARAACITRLSSIMMDVIPLLDFESQGQTAVAILKLRTLILKQHKTAIVSKVLKSLQKTDISRPSIAIDRTKARWSDDSSARGGEDSIFAQIYYALGKVSTVVLAFHACPR